MISAEWRPVPFADGYEVSNFGDVRSISRTIIRKDGKPYPVKGKLLKQRTYNYATVDLKIGSPVTVHRIVASAFLGLDYSDKKVQVNHIDGNRLNNMLLNLELCDASYNVKDGFNRGRVIHNKGKSRLCEDDIIEIKSLSRSGLTQREIAKRFNVSQSLINGVLKNDHIS